MESKLRGVILQKLHLAEVGKLLCSCSGLR